MRLFTKFVTIYILSTLCVNLLNAQTPPGNALSFDGTSTYVSAAIPNYITNNGNSFTVEAWVNPATLTPASFSTLIAYGYDDGSSGNGISLGIGTTGTLQVLFSQVASVQETGYTFPAANHWYHVAMTRYGGSGVTTVYVNGVQTTNTFTNSPLTPSEFRLGSQHGIRYFNGKMDEVRIYSYPEPATNIQADMFSTSISDPTHIVTYYNFDQGVAGGTNTGVTTLPDVENNWPGTLNNFALAGSTSNWVESYAMVMPTATAGSTIANGFTANWTAPAIGTVTNYLLDVASDAAFASPVSGSPFTIAGGTTSKAVSGLTGGATYYYRVRADKTSVTGQGGYLNVITQAAGYTPPGNALEFNSGNNYVSIANNPITNSFTVETWLLLNANSGNPSTNPRIFDFGNSTNHYCTMYITSSSTIGYQIVVGSTLQTFTSSTAVTLGKWTHIAVTYDQPSSTATIYFNGVQVGQSTSITLYPANIGSLSNSWLGRSEYYNVDPNLNGSLDEFRIWNSARSQAQIQANMLNSVAANSAGLLLYYNFDQGVGGATNTGITGLPDQTSTGATGTLNNFTLSGNTSNWVESYAMAVPTATAATPTANTSFTANWTAPVVGTVDNGYRLDVSTASDFSAPITGSPFTVSGTSKSITGLTAGTTYYYRVSADKTSVTGQGGYSNSISYRVYLWNGITNTDWNTNTNWTPNGIPTSSDNAIIPSTTNKPIITGSTAAVANNLTIQNGAILNIASGGTLTVSAGVTVNAGAAITGNYAGITGTATLQQSIIAQRGWRVFANPFSTSQTFSTVASNNAISIQTTGSSNAAGIADNRTFSNTTNTWSDGGTSIAANTPYGLFIRGLASEVTGLSYSGGPTAFTYNVTGTLNGATTSVTPTSTANFLLVGNPYAAPVNSQALTGQTASTNYYVYTISQGGSQTAQRTNAGSWVAASSSSNTSNTIPVLGVIAYQPASLSSFSITPSDINTGGTLQTGLFGVQSPAQQIELSVEQNGDFRDKLFVRLDANATAAGTERADLLKFYNDNVNVYTISTTDNTRMSIDARNVLNTIPLGISGLTGDYNFKLTNNSLPEGTTVYLNDKLLNTKTALKTGDTYNFSITSDASTMGEQRFELSFSIKSTATANDPQGGLTANVLGNITGGNLIAVQIAGATTPVTIAIKDMSGKALGTISAANGIQYVNVGNTAKGMLLLQISDGKSSIIKKVMKL